MKPNNNVALKEWNSVVEALKHGRQLLLLRKGGLADKGRRFAVEEPEFFFYPTFTHQEEQHVRPEFRVALEAPEEDGFVRVTAYAVVEEAVEAKDPAVFESLTDHHIWTPEFIRMRFAYKPENSLWALLLRVYTLERPVEVPELRKYRGCRSWVRLEQEIPVANATPVMDDVGFARKVDAVRRALAGQARA